MIVNLASKGIFTGFHERYIYIIIHTHMVLSCMNICIFKKYNDKHVCIYGINVYVSNLSKTYLNHTHVYIYKLYYIYLV